MLLSNRATTLLKLERLDDALADTSASIELNSQSFKVYRTRARTYLHLEKYEAAIGDFKTAIEQAKSEGCEADAKALQTEMKKAEVDLKRSKTKDYYKILGVSRECTEVEIKKAYRRESLKHHPDKVRDFTWRITPLLTDYSRVETRRNSNSLWKRTACYPIPHGESDMTWARTIQTAPEEWEVTWTSPSSSPNSTRTAGSAVAASADSQEVVQEDTAAIHTGSDSRQETGHSQAKYHISHVLMLYVILSLACAICTTLFFMITSCFPHQ